MKNAWQIRIADRIILLLRFISFHFNPLNHTSQNKKVHILSNQLFHCYSILHTCTAYFQSVRRWCNTNWANGEQNNNKNNKTENDSQYTRLLFINVYIFICMSLHCWLIYHPTSFPSTKSSMRAHSSTHTHTHNKIEHGLLCLLKIHQFNTQTFRFHQTVALAQ